MTTKALIKEEKIIEVGYNYLTDDGRAIIRVRVKGNRNYFFESEGKVYERVYDAYYQNDEQNRKVEGYYEDDGKYIAV